MNGDALKVYQHEYYLAVRAKGLCAYCRKAPARTGKTVCFPCAAKRSAEDRAKYAATKKELARAREARKRA